jgi:hypothetical protein
MNKVLVPVVWYFAPGLHLAQEAISRGTTPRMWRMLFLHTLPRVFVFAAFVWMLVIGSWYPAAILGVLMVGLGLVHWLLGRWFMARLGGTHARSDV